jgi:hopanoid biosynthesis associated RND transporter like protein HpnN
MKAEKGSGHKPTVVQRLLVGLVDAVCRCPALVLATAGALCALSLFASVNYLEYRTQRTDLVSPDKDYQKRWREYLAEFGDDDDIVVVVKGRPSHRTEMRAALDQIAARARALPDYFDRLFYKVDLRPLQNRALLFLPSAQIQQIENYLQSDDMSWLLRPRLDGVERRMVSILDPQLVNLGWRMVSLDKILSKAGRVLSKREAGQAPAEADKQILAQLASISRAATASLDAPDAYRNPWQSLVAAGDGQKAAEQARLLTEPQYFFSGDGSLAFLLVRPVKEKGSFTAAARSVSAMRDIVADARVRFPQLEMGMTGLPVLETDEMAVSESDTRKASVLALAGIVLLFVVVYRGIRNPFLTVTTLLVGTVLAMGWVTLTVGHLNILSATFAVMLIGMGDYGVLWVTRYEENRAAGHDLRTALRKTAAGGGPSILTAATATALAFYAAMLADFQAVAELGWIAGSGVLLCALSCFTVLPAMICVFDRRAVLAANPVLHDPNILSFSNLKSQISNRSWLPALACRPRWVIAAGLGLTVFLGVHAFRIRYDHNLLHLQAQDLASVKWQMTLINHTDGASWHALSFTDSPEQALALKARYEKLPEVSRVVEVASLLPPDQQRKLAQLRNIQDRLQSLPDCGDIFGHAPPAISSLKDKLDQLARKLSAPESGTGHRVVADLRQSLTALSDRLAGMPESLAACRLQKFEEHLTRDLVENLHQLRQVSTPVPITLADLPPSMRERYLGKTGKWLLQVFARDCLWEHGPLKAFVDNVSGVDPGATGKPFGTLYGLKSLRSGFQWAGLYALIAIVLVFLADFKHLRYTLLALTPLAMGVVISLGVMGLCRLSLNPANMIAFPLILGVGAVYGVHVVHDYLVQGTARSYTLSYIIGRAILVMALTNMISFGTLSLSSHRGLSGLGFTLMLGVCCCMVTALVFLPALLRVLAGGKAGAVASSDHVETSRIAA